ncbi:MAG: GNAT family N-acetyltransferase [Clostridia bacterium]|nr:GNAT family N-acetyltransferase [Clostridia bacterium]
MIYYQDAHLTIRDFAPEDVAPIVQGEIAQGWHASAEKYEDHLRDARAGRAVALAAVWDDHAAGYVNVHLPGTEGPFAGRGWPEIVDFGVLEAYRRRGIGSKLMDAAEAVAARHSDRVYLAVGLHNGYGSAQRMYIRRGYMPDGSGAWYNNRPCTPYDTIYTNNDDLVLYLTKRLTEPEGGYVLRSARFVAADVLKRAISPGDTVIDATMGNGHDTLALCQWVGEGGRVYAFDVQAQAVEHTRARLAAAGVADRAALYCLGHEHMAEKVNGPVSAVVFNLGWLPGGDHAVTTRWETTRAAVESALGLLKKQGVLVICAYPGHAEGDREREALTAFLTALRPQDFNVLAHRFLNAGPGAPECFVVQKQ